MKPRQNLSKYQKQMRRLGTETEILTIDVKPGWKKGTKITFQDKGNEQPNQLPADLVFVIDEKPHTFFKRDGNDLIVNYQLKLAEAIGGTSHNITTLDQRDLVIPLTDIVTPGCELVILKRGYANYKRARNRGDLKILFEVKFHPQDQHLSKELPFGNDEILGAIFALS